MGYQFNLAQKTVIVVPTLDATWLRFDDTGVPFWLCENRSAMANGGFNDASCSGLFELYAWKYRFLWLQYPGARCPGLRLVQGKHCQWERLAAIHVFEISVQRPTLSDVS